MNIKVVLTLITLLASFTIRAQESGKSRFQQVVDAERALNSSIHNLHGGSISNAYLARAAADALITLSRLKGGSPESYIPSDVDSNDRAIVLRALKEDGLSLELVAEAAIRNANQRDSIATMDKVAFVSAAKNGTLRQYTSTQIEACPGLPVPAVAGGIESVIIYGSRYTATTKDGGTVKGTFIQNIDSNGYGVTKTTPDSSNYTITMRVTPFSRQIE